MWPSSAKAWRTWSATMCNRQKKVAVEFRIRNGALSDLDSVTALEAVCFPPAEAAGREAFAYRLQTFPERFFVAEQNGRIIGLINGCASSLPAIADGLFEPQGHEPDGKNQMVFGLAVHPDHRRQGVAAALMERLVAFARETAMERVILTCKEEKISYYAKFGFQNRGVSASTHGGAVWYDMVLEIRP